jgi:SlyX protein
MAEPKENRMVQIESHLAELERTVEQLNQVLIEQGKVLARIQMQQKQMAQTVESIELERIKSGNAKPPHYQ